MCLGVLNDLLEFIGFLMKKPFIKLVVESQAKVPVCAFPWVASPIVSWVFMVRTVDVRAGT